MIFTIREDGKLYTEAGKSIPFKHLTGYVIRKIHKSKGIIKLELDAKPIVTPEDNDVAEADIGEEVEQQTSEGSRLCRTEPIRGGKKNKFLEMMKGLKIEKDAGFDKVNDNITPTPRMRTIATTQKFNVTCFCCGKTFKVPKHEVPPTIEGEQMSYRCHGCCKR